MSVGQRRWLAWLGYRKEKNSLRDRSFPLTDVMGETAVECIAFTALRSPPLASFGTTWALSPSASWASITVSTAKLK